jgi:hypothetical protein
VSFLSTLLGELRRRALGISAEEIRYTFEDVRAEIRSVRAELREELSRLRRELGAGPMPDEREGEDDPPEAKA